MKKYIIIESDNEVTRVEINGKTDELIDMIANAIINDKNFGILVLTAIAAIAQKDNDPINQINLN